MDDLQIIAMLKRRDPDAAEKLIEKYGALCRSIASHILRDRRDVEETVNGVMMRLWSSIPPAEPADLAAYTAKAARNEALMRLRKNTATANKAALVPLAELEAVLPGPEAADGHAEAAELTRAIGRFLASSKPEKRRAFIRRYWFFDGISEIAERYGISESKVKSILFRMRNELKVFLEKEELL